MKKVLLFMSILIPLKVAAAPSPVGPLNFGGGVNYQTSPIDIQDNQSPDQCNCVSGTDGSLEKIGGTKRFIEQSRSSYPVTSLYRAYASSGTVKKSVLLAINGPFILASTNTINPFWTTLSSFITPGQHWSFVTMNNKVYMTGDGLTDNIKEYDIFRNSIRDIYNVASGSDSAVIRAKYLTMKSNYLIMANVLDLTAGSTHYASRFHFSLLNQPSSSTYTRAIDVRTNDGEELVGVGINNDRVNFFKNSTIHELNFTILDRLPLGDQELSEVVNGFGLQSPRTLESDGIYYIIGSKDSIRMWDGGRRGRLNLSEEVNSISDDIKPLLDRLIQAGTYETMVGKYYRKREWYVLSYEDPLKSPLGVNNSVIIYDLKLKQWYPICGWLADSFVVFDNLGDKGELLYGDSSDGVVYYADLETEPDNAPRNIVIDTMDSLSGWQGITGNINRDVDNVKEGTASIRMWINPLVQNSSMTKMVTLQLGSWPDKSKVLREDKLSFKFLTTSTENLRNVRVDLSVDDGITNQFNHNFTSFTFSNFSLFRSSQWYTMEIKLSSFPTNPEWSNLSSEEVPFGDTLNYYGIRFYVDGVAESSITIDDVRLVQNYNKLNFYRFTKLFNFGTIAFKTLGQLLLTSERHSDSELKVDIYNDFGKKVNTKLFAADIPKEIFLLGYASTSSIALINDTDFTIIKTTSMNPNEYLPLNGVATKDHIFFPDRANDRLVKMSRQNFGAILSTVGQIGSGVEDFNLVHQIDAIEESKDKEARLVVIDMSNQRVKEHSQEDLSFIRTVGSLGIDATSYHQPTGITVNNESIVVSDEGNYRFTKLDVSTLGVSLQVEADYNTIGDSSMEEDENYYYIFYNKISNIANYYQDAILEKRDKGNLSLISQTRVTPMNSVTPSTYAVQGSMALRGRYCYVVFTDNSLGVNPTFYLQKRLRSDFSIVKELILPKECFSVLGDAYAYKPSIKTERIDLEAEGRYIQLKFYDELRDNYIKLINQAFIIDPQDITY